MGSQLTDMIRKKYPGAYDNMSDDDLEKSVLEKYPQYKELASPPANVETETKPAEELKIDTKPNVVIKPDVVTKTNEEPSKPFNPMSLVKSGREGLGWLWDKATTPLSDLPMDLVDKIADPIRDYGDSHDGYLGSLARGSGAELHSIGQQLSGFTSPLGFAATALPGVGSVASKVAPEAGAIISGMGRAANVPFMLHGGSQMLSGDSLQKKLMGALEAGMGYMGARGHMPELANKIGGDEVPNFKSANIPADEPVNPLAVASPDMVPVGEEAKFNELHPKTPIPDPVEAAVDRLLGPRELNHPDLKNIGKPDVRDMTPTRSGEVSDFAKSVLTGDNTEPNPFPEFARTDKGGVKIGADVESLGKILGSSLYQGDIRTIATKELVQNAIDAIRPMEEKGQVHVEMHDYGEEPHIIVRDNGKGMTPKEVETVFTDLGSSGKRSDESAIGGFGLAKAAPLLGGKRVEFETVAPVQGQLIKTSFSGTPDELLKGVESKKQIVPSDTPTGTKVKVVVPKEGSFYDANRFVGDINEHSDFPGELKYTRHYYNPTRDYTTGKEVESDWVTKDKDIPPAEHVTTIKTPSADIDMSIPGNADKEGTRSSYQLVTQNNGMFQHINNKYLGEQGANIPSQVKVNIRPKVSEGHPDYPFTANREGLRGTVSDAIDKYIHENIVKPNQEKYKTQLQDLYNNMQETEPDALGRSFHFHDTGNRYTPEEIQSLKDSPIIRDLTDKLQNSIKGGMSTAGTDAWKNRLERIGLIFDENLHGIHIPNPSNGKSAILINPFSHALGEATPDTSAAGLFHTAMHELAHVEPGDRGHNESFAGRLGDIYTKVGARNALKHQDAIESAISSGGQYNPEFQKLLQQYQESRGRGQVKDDLLTRTGTHQAVTPNGPEGNATNSGPTTNGTPAPVDAGATPLEKSMALKKFNEPAKMMTEPQKMNAWKEANGAIRSIMTSYDISAPGRQGLPLALNKEYWTSFADMFKAWGSQRASDAVKESIYSHPNFRPEGKLPSLAERAGLRMGGGEEMFQSKLAEMMPGVPASERAYNAFLGKLRSDTFNRLVDDYRANGQDPAKNDQLLQGIGKFINDATGRGSLGPKFEKALPVLNDVMFAPRLMASRVNMYKTLLNPLTYANNDPIMRQQALKSLLAITGIGQTLGALAKYAGATVSGDPTSSDFGKIKVGNTRTDPYAGFQQYAVAANRILSGQTTSSVTGKTTDLDSGRFGMPTRASVAGNFMTSKLAPIPSFVYSMLQGKEFDGTSFDAKNAIASRTIPLVIQDLTDIWKQDPSLFPKGTLAGASPTLTKGLLSVPPIVGFGSQTYGR